MALLPRTINDNYKRILTPIKRPDAHEQDRRDAHIVYSVALKANGSNNHLYFTKFYLPDFTKEKAAALQLKLASDKAVVRFDPNGVQMLSRVGMFHSAWSDPFKINYNDLKASEYHALYANVEIVSPVADTYKKVPLV